MSEQSPQTDTNATGTDTSAPEQDAASAPGPAADTLDTRLSDALAKIEEQRETMLRALADAENSRKRALAEAANAQKYALERFIEGLLPVVDSLEAALNTSNATAETLRSGADLTLKQLTTALEKSHAGEIAPKPGEKFDPHRHQAMASVEADAEPNSVVSVLQKGWMLHERVIRPALVTVAKPRPANDA